MRVIVPGPLGWQSSLPVQMTRSPNANLRDIAVFMTTPPSRSPDKKAGSMGDASGTARPIPLWRLRSGPRSSPIDQCSDYRPPNTSHTLTMLNLALSSILLAWRDGYRFSCLVFKRRIRSPTTSICSTSSSVMSTPTKWSSIANINSTRSSKSAPRSFVKCVSEVTNSMSTTSCFAIRVRRSLMENRSCRLVSC